MFSASPPPAGQRRRASRVPQSRVVTPPTRAGSVQPLRLHNSMLHDDVALHLAHGQASPDRTLDAAHRSVFSHSDQLTIAFHGNVPLEVRHVLVSADLYGDQFSGTVDALTGYALLVSPHTVFVWQPKATTRGSITCYLFPSPGLAPRSTAPTHLTLPVASLVHYGPLREPGLILISQTGELRFWESIGVGLSGAEGFVSNQLMLQSGEQVVALHRCDHLLYVASTSAGRLFRIAVSTNGHVIASPFSASQQSSWNIFAWSSNSPRPSTRCVVSLALGAKTRQGQDVWVLTEDALQRWLVSPEGWEQFGGDAVPNLHQMLVERLSRDQTGLADLELLDVVVSSSTGVVTLLLSHQGDERRLYELVELRPVASTMEFASSRGLSYEPSRPAHTPRMALVREGDAVLVQFSDALVLSFRESEFQELARLKYAGDRIFGFALNGSEARVLLNNMMLAVTVGSAPTQREGDDEEVVGATLLRQVMTRAILYGPVPDNPLSFRFPPDVDGGNLMAGSEMLSHAVLVSDPELVKPAVDLTTQLQDRMSRLSFLIHFINDNAVQQKLSPASRQNLQYDAERLYAAQQLWTYYNESRRNDSGEHNDVLVHAIELYMHEAGALEADDLVRAFFKNEIHHLPALLRKLAAITRDAAQSYEGSRDLPAVLCEANRVVLKVLEAAHEFRERHAALYGLASGPTAVYYAEPWTSGEGVLQTTRGLFEETDKLLVTYGDSEAERARRDAEVERQFCDLGTEVLRAFSERLAWLERATREGTGNERERALLEEQFVLQRPQVLRTLVNRGCVNEAFKLAEEYRDYRTLTELCHERIAEPDEQLELYTETYQEDYAFDLYSFWIERGMGKRLFENAELHPRLVDEFFRENENPRLSWIQDVTQRRHADAADALLRASDTEVTTAGKQASRCLMLSIGKLCMMAQVKPGDAVDEEETQEFNYGLDFIAWHKELVRDFRESVNDMSEDSFEAVVDDIMAVHGRQLEESRPSCAAMFRNLVRLLMQGRALDSEDLIDVMTWKDNSASPGAFAHALRLLYRAGDAVPDARRRLALGNIWRRILLHDDWASIQNTAHLTDEQLVTRMRRTALYHTLRDVAEGEGIPAEYVLVPQLILQAPLEADVDARWPGLTPRERMKLAEDFEWECAHLQSFDIKTLYEAVARREREERIDEDEDAAMML
ncbi:hypothetical protein EXIGLDRAFT_840672 [Exidia glandulosa HHB12029]|uniref:Nucleoporin Nup133/Nup155-like C-terminal domain-containing protein n=1 Tax=Exidia glandulosa HHB12029 TaxID=1314781 RepID=A0A165EBS3_EXIGL|nr:hypothetical protein EXIGLDRAFT_840672 [Exidia glandulosa HHB12029]